MYVYIFILCGFLYIESCHLQAERICCFLLIWMSVISFYCLIAQLDLLVKFLKISILILLLILGIHFQSDTIEYDDVSCGFLINALFRVKFLSIPNFWEFLKWKDIGFVELFFQKLSLWSHIILRGKTLKKSLKNGQRP